MSQGLQILDIFELAPRDGVMGAATELILEIKLVKDREFWRLISGLINESISPAVFAKEITQLLEKHPFTDKERNWITREDIERELKQNPYLEVKGE